MTKLPGVKEFFHTLSMVLQVQALPFHSGSQPENVLEYKWFSPEVERGSVCGGVFVGVFHSLCPVRFFFSFVLWARYFCSKC